MPWPMVHFAVAERVSLSNPSPEFLLGSISPDAIHARDPVTREEKGATHLMNEGEFPSVDTLKKSCLTFLHKDKDPEWKEFVLGYFAHIYTDIRWTHTLYADFEKDYTGDADRIRAIYNQEVSQAEFHLLRSEAWAGSALAKLQRAHAYAMEPFVTQHEVSEYRDIKLAWLWNDRNEPGIHTKYFTEEKVKHFIRRTSSELLELFRDLKIDDRRSIHR